MDVAISGSSAAAVISRVAECPERIPLPCNCAGEGQRTGRNFISLVPRPFPGGAWAPLLAHARRFKPGNSCMFAYFPFTSPVVCPYMTSDSMAFCETCRYFVEPDLGKY